MGSFFQDLRIGWRSLARTPAFTFVVVIVMALGIGANTMIFNVANAFLFHKFPYVDDQRNVRIWESDSRHDQKFMELSTADFRDIRDRAKSFEAICAFSETQAYITLGREPERFDATFLTSGTFATFNTNPVIGRDFMKSEEDKGPAYTVIILSHRMWKDRFHSDPKVLGRTLRMNGRVRTIIGVAPPEFRLPETADFFIPYPYDPKEDSRDSRHLDVAALLKPGVSLEQGNAEVAKIGADLKTAYPKEHANSSMRATDFREHLVADMGPMLAILMSAVGFVLLIACANVANLLLARGAGRHREMALRFALGATRGRIVRQLMTESLILAVIGGGLGMLLAMWGRDMILASIPEELPFWMKFDNDLNTVLFLIGSSLLAALLAGTMPALQTSQVDVHEALKEGGLHGASSKRRNRMRSALVVAEISLALVLLAGAGLMIKSFMRMSAERVAIQPEGVLTGRFTMPVAVYDDDAKKLAFSDALLSAVAALPGVEGVSAIQALPLGNNSWFEQVWLPGDPVDDPKVKPRTVFLSLIRPDYFKVMGIPLRKGRDFEIHDGLEAPRVAIVSATAARRLWPDKDPIGQRFKWSHDDTTGWKTVVGVVADVLQSVDDSKREPETIYVPHRQNVHQTMTLLVKHTGSPASLATAIRRTVQSRDADMPLYDVRTMDEWLRYSLWENRIYVVLMSVFAVLALMIAAIGIYGVMAYTVAQRTQEIGIRMALGAARRDVMRMVVSQALRMTALGIGIGLAGAYGVTRLMASVLFGVSATDPPTFIGVTVILAGSALIAAWIPADRATRVDPMVALRSE
jgi:putative ABC transport system permease protein